MLELLAATIAGCITGTITGLTPGLHVNTVCSLIISLATIFEDLPVLEISVFIFATAITQTFVDAIPAIFLGAPEESMALSVLPGHRMLFNGQGHAAVKYTIIGSLLGNLSIILLIPLLFLISKLYFSLKSFIPSIVFLTSMVLILREKNKFWAFIVFMLSGILGILVLGSSLKEPLLAIFSGLFGISTLVISLISKAKIPEQKFGKIETNKKALAITIPKACFASMLCGFFPGMGASQAAVIATSLSKKWTPKDYLVLVGSINTMVMFISLVAMYTIGKARSGAILAISKFIPINLENFITLIIVSLIACGFGTIATLSLSKIFAKKIKNLNYTAISLCVIVFIFMLNFAINRFFGILVLITATFIGMIAPLWNVPRYHLMGCLVLPIFLYSIL